MAKTFTTEKERRSRSHMNDPIRAWSDAIAARRVLRDCHIAVRRYGSATEGAERRIAWVTVVTLLRAVGHVLDRVDGSRSDFLRAAIDECWSEVGAGGAEHEIFHDFIERERNNILKKYRAGEARVEPIWVDLPQGDDLLIGSRLLSMQKALQEALHWWEVLLGRVEDGAHRQLLKGRDMDARRHHQPR